MEPLLTIKVATNYELSVKYAQELEELALVKGYVSIDTEYDSSKPESSGIDLIQLGIDCDSEPRRSNTLTVKRNATVYVFNIKEIGTLVKPLSDILTNDKIVKLGCGFDADRKRLTPYGITCTPLVDIQHIAHTCGFRLLSLNEISDIICGLVKESTRDMIKYAAYDAYLILECYLQMVPYKAPITNSAPSTPTKDSALAFWKWLNIILSAQGKSMHIDRLRRAVNSGYTEWKYLYAREHVPQALNETLLILARLGYITFTNDRVALVPTTPTYTPPAPTFSPVGEYSFDLPPHAPITDEVPIDDIRVEDVVTLTTEDVHTAINRTRVSCPPGGLKRDKYINSLKNCNWHDSPAATKNKYANLTIDIGLRNKFLGQHPNGNIQLLPHAPDSGRGAALSSQL